MADELDDEERELLRKHREKRQADSDEVELGSGDKFFRGSFRRAREVARAWGFPLEAEHLEDEGKPKGKPGPDGGEPGEVRKFGRRVG